MIIPLQHPQVKTARARQHLRMNAQSKDVQRFDQQVSRLVRYAASGLRGSLMLSAFLACIWQIDPAVYREFLGLAMIVACLMAGSGWIGRLPFWLALAGDSIAVLLVVHGSGGPASPLLGLTFLLILQGCLLTEGRDAIAGSALGFIVVLLLYLLRPTISAGLPLLALLSIYGACSAMAYLACRSIATMVWRLRDQAAQGEEYEQKQSRLQQLFQCQRLNLQINACDSMSSLVCVATERATSIAGALASIELPKGGQAGHAPAVHDHIFHLPITDGKKVGALIVYRRPGEIDQFQRAALEHLAVLVGLRFAILRYETQIQCRQQAVMALWEIAGILRIAPDVRSTLLESCRRMATMLGMDWIALLAPNEQRALAPFIIAQGNNTAEATRLNGAQIRVAAEAMRAEHPLVRNETDRVFVCLPICRADAPPLVISACGGAVDADLQAILLLFGELINDRLAGEARTHRASWEGYRQAV